VSPVALLKLSTEGKDEVSLLRGRRSGKSRSRPASRGVNGHLEMFSRVLIEVPLGGKGDN